MAVPCGTKRMRNWFSISSPTARTRRLPSDRCRDHPISLRSLSSNGWWRRSLGRQGAVVETKSRSWFLVELDVELQRPTREKSTCGRRRTCLRRAQLRVEASADHRGAACGRFDERLFRLAHRIALEGVVMMLPYVVALGEKTSKLAAPLKDLVQAAAVTRLRFDNDSPVSDR